MKKPTFSKAVFAVFILLLSFTSVAQTLQPFAIRKNVELRGKMLVIGNNILGKDNNPLNDNSVNENISMVNIDIDGDASTFNSSSANLLVPNQANGSPTTCYRVTYAALYWGAMLQSGSRTNINKVKLKLPGATTYNDITGTVVYDAISTPIVPDNNTPYACYADVTSLLANLPGLAGTYTVADVLSSTGFNGSTGLSAGWTLFVIYEDPTLNMKSFTTFDGFSALYDGRTETIPVTGFRTPPAGNVDLQFAYAALDGDKPQNKSKLEFGTKEVSTPLRGPANNFFNSTIENSWGVSDPRNPSGSNTLGYDTGMLEVKNADPEYINNNQTSTNFTLQVAKGQADPVFAFFGAYAVDIIAPKIDLTKIVKNTSGVDIGGGNVNLAQSIIYEISYQSTGNDNVKNFTIKDVLPQNLVFDPATGIDYTNAGGATLQSYDAATRTLIFKIPEASVLVNGGLYTIRLKVQVAPDCNSLATACSNVIKNQAFATYQGVINTDVVQEEGSYASTVCKLGAPESTNFIVDISNCKFTQNVILCGSSVVLRASDGYSNYSWSRNADGSSPIGTGQTFTATQTGVYYVHNTAPLTCKDIVEQITVTYFGVTNTNPVIPFADQLVTCANDGKVLPNIFLCGANATRLIKTGISDAASIVWEKLDEVACPSTAIANCANENFANSCWKQVGTGPDYLANTAGQFRVTLNYSGGCFSIFYFNVYQNLLAPTYTKKDIVCTTPGKITIGGVPTGYEFSLDGVNYQLDNPEFIITTAGSYTVYIKQQGVTTNPCIFQVPDILINNRTMNVRTFVTQPSCNGINDGSIKLIAENVEPQYYFSIEQGGTLVNSVPPIAVNEYTFANLSPGNYTVKVSTDDNCTYTATVDIINPPLIKVTANVTKPLTCIDGEITINIEGGTPNYNYYVNGTYVSLNSASTSFAFPVSTAGTYDIKVDDLNNCPATTSVPISAIPPPVYTVAQTNILCYGSNIGEIRFTVTNANGYTLAYSIDNGANYLPTPTFSNLADGTYNTIVRYTLGTSVCYGVMQAITITAPSTALTASAGVSELAGCTLSGQGGKLRITNPQGGVAPYLYSFDNQATWVTTNEADMLPGTYTLYIKDANGCIYPMPNVILDPKPVPPTIDVATPVFNCDGTANSTVTVTNTGGASYEYGYLLNGTANTNVPSNVFVNVPSGSHTVSVTYKLLTVPTYSNLLKEDFGNNTFAYTATSSPDASSPGINPAFCWERQVDATKCNADRELRNGEYTVTSTLRNNFYSGWNNPVDHTAGSSTGRYLAVDAGTAIPNNAVLYRKTIKDIIPNQPIQVRFFATNLLKVGNTQPDASLTVELQNSSGAPLSSQSTGGIPKTNGWVEFNKTIDPGANTTLDFVLRLEVAQVNGIDFAVDDIEVYQLPKTCITQVDFPFEVPTGKAFTASVTGFKDITCAGANNGEITIAAQNFDPVYGFDYSIDGGANWVNSKISPVTISGLSANTYTPLLRYNAAGACPLTLTPVTINAPTPLTVTASVTTQATCTTGAVITAVGGGGTPVYQYELRQSDGVTVVTAFNNNPVFTNVSAGDYTIFIKDANGCTNSVGAAVNVVAPPTLTATLDSSTDLCYTSANPATLVVNVSGGVGPFTYSLDGAAAQTSNTFTNVGPGTHDILVTDSNNCTATISGISIATQLLPVASVTKALDCSSTPNATITVNIAGGTAPYTYTVQKGTGTPSAASSPSASLSFTYDVSNANADTYTFVVTDANGCPATTSATVNPLVPVAATTTDINPTCNGGSNGSVQIAASGGVGPYTYSFNGSASSGMTLYTGLQANVAYPYVVTDSKGCTFSGSVTLTQPVAISGIAVVTVPYTCSQNATIEAQNVSGGTGVYSYSIDGITFQASPTFTGLTNGTYTITIKDINNCPFVTPSVTIAPLTPPTDLTFMNSALMCPANTSDVTITSTVGGSGVKTYQIIAPYTTAYQTSNIFTGLAPGTYTFQVKDDKDCTYHEDFTINSLPAVTVIGQLVSNVQCLGSSTGAVRFTVSGATNFTYTINGVAQGVGASPINLTGLAEGNYAIVITNTDTNCTATTSVTVNAPSAALTLNKTVTPIKCSTDGSVVVTATGGWGGYSYTLTQPDTTVVGPQGGTFSNLSQPGTYTISVTDANNCLVTDTFTLTAPVQPTVGIVGSDLCYDSTDQATIVVTASLGSSPYQYSIDGGVTYQSSNTFANLIPGTYSVMVKDAYGCTSVALAQTIATQLTVNTVLTKDLDCTSSPDAVITGTITQGYPGFKYAVSINGGAYSAPVTVVGTTFSYPVTVASVVATTTYQFQVTDLNNCPATSGIITINPRVQPTATTTVTDLTCYGSANGSVTINPSLGVAPYTFSFNGSGFTSNATYGGLAAGTYNYIVKDSKDCTFNGSVTVNEPALISFTPIVTNMSCPPASILGSIEVTGITNGVGPFTYVLKNTVTNAILPPDPGNANLFPNLSFGTYDLTVTDSKGCSVTETRDVLAPPADLDINISTPVSTCAAGATIVVSVNPTPVPPGTPYSFGIYDMVVAPFSSALQPSDATSSLQSTFTGLTPGVTYTFVVYDSITGCYYFEKALGAVTPLTPLKSTIDSVNPVTCKGTATGNVSFTVSDYAGTSIDYEVFYDQTNLSTGITGHISTAAPTTVTNFGAFTPGTYYIVFTEKDGANVDCTSASATFTITESANDLIATAAADKNDNCNHTGQISAIVQGGTAPYQYELVGDPSNVGGAVNIAYSGFSTFPNSSAPGVLLTTGNYTVNIKDANGCIISKPVFLDIDAPPVVAASISTSNQCTATEGNFVINVDVSSTTTGIPPYSFSIDGGVFQNMPSSFTITGLSSGSHTVEIKDANGCGNLVSIPILAPLGLTPAVSTIVTCPSNVGEITANAIGGSGTYTYTINPVAGTLVGNVFTNLPANTYTVKVTDDVTNCEVSKTVVLEAPTPVTFSTTKTDVSCNGDSNGTITVILPASNNNPTYTYEITAPIVVAAQNSNVFTGLPAGTYTIRVNSGKGCYATNTETVGTPLALLVDATSSVSAFGCAPDNSINTATVTVVATSGTGTTPYTYSIDGTNYFTTNTFNIIDTGATSITVYIKDANGCIATRVLPITPLPKITAASATVNAAIDCNNTGSLIVNVTGGSGNFSFQMLPAGVAQLSNVFAVTTPGTYYFRVNDVTTGCYFDTAAYTVVPFNTIDVVATATTPVTCFGDSNGAIAINVSGYGGAYSYEVFNNVGTSVRIGTGDVSITNPQPITGLLAGNYTVVVTETASPFCVKTSNVVTIGSPSAAVSVSAITVNDNCNVNAGQIVANAQGGTAPYLYQILPATATAPLVTSSGWTSTNTLSAESGNYVVYVKDVNDCPQFTPVTIGLDPTPVVAAVLNAQCGIAEGQFAIDVTVPTAGIPPYSFSIDGSGFQIRTAPFTISNLSSGVHTIEIKDFNGCGSAIVSVPILAPLTLTPIVTTLPSCANNDGVITVSATGGSGNYVYNIDGGVFGATTSFNNVTSGSHSMGVRDTTTLCEVYVPINLTPATPITGFALSATPVTCNGGNDGTITATMATPAPGVNDNPVYTYVLNGTTVGGVAVTRPSQASPLFSGLAAGNYNVVVTSGRGCTATASIPVTEPGIINVPAPAVVPFGCTSGNAMNFATITVSGVSGGSGTYSIYEFFKNGASVQRGASNVYTETNLAGGSYTVTVYDNKGCEGSTLAPITIAPFTAMDKINVVVNQTINCNTPESITVTAVDASGVAIPGIQYTLVDKNATTGVIGGVYPSQTNTTGVFTGLTVANYMVTATNPATGCSIQDVHYVNEPNTFDLTINSIVDVTCFGGTNGTANVTIVDRTLPDQAGPFSYTLLWPNGTTTTGNSSVAGPLALTGLVAGTYTITATLTNTPFCTVSKAFTINGPTAALSISETHTRITCVAGNNDGTITGSATGGWPGGYQFELVGPVSVAYSAQSTFTGLTAGDYTLNVRDSKGCIATTTINLSNPTPIVFTATPSATTLSCFGDRSASITASLPTGGQGSNYLYTLTTTSLVPATVNGPQTSPVFNGLGAGTYTITVTDGYSCSATSGPITISEPTKVIGSLVVASTQTCTTQTRLTLSATGGTGPYTYSSDGTTYGTSFASSVSIDVAPGTYHYYVKDANGCISNISNDIKIDPLVPLTINLDKVNPVINCAGDSNGVITAEAQGGLGNYVYTLTNVDTGIVTAPQSTGVFKGLIAGNYKVHVDSGDCTKEVLVTITQPTSVFTASAATIPVTCNGNGDGKIVITAGGGTGEIRYAISPNSDQFFVGNLADGHSFNNLKPGFYTIIAQDQNGCFHLETVEITEPNPIAATVVAGSVQQELCSGEKTGAFSISITGGVGPFSTSLDNPNGTYVLGQVDFTGLSGGDHTVYIKDANTCTFDLLVSLNPSVTLNPVATVNTDCVNNLPANKVKVTIDPSNIPADVTYSLDSTGPSQSSNIFTNLTPGSHFIMVQHKNGCVDATDPFTIDQIDPLTISIDLGGLNEIVATVTGGSGVYQFTVNGESIGSNNKYIYFRSGDYTVTVTDSNGCSVSATKYFEFIDIKIPPIFTPTGDGTNDTWKPTNTENYPDIKFVVYDRYGRQVGVFGAGQSWDGKYNGTELPMGDYWYVLKLRHSQDDREFVGHFTLYR